MIRELAAAAGGWAYVAAEKVWGHRRFAFGPPTDGFTSQVFGGTAVNPGQAGLAMSWHGDDEGAVIRFNAGPLELWLHVAGVDATSLDPGDGLHGRWVVRGDDGRERTVHLYGPVNNLGALIEWTHAAAGRGLRVTVGPVGFVINATTDSGGEAR